MGEGVGCSDSVIITWGGGGGGGILGNCGWCSVIVAEPTVVGCSKKLVKVNFGYSLTPSMHISNMLGCSTLLIPGKLSSKGYSTHSVIVSPSATVFSTLGATKLVIPTGF